MINYKLYKFNGEVVGACYETTLGTCFFGFKDPNNTDYTNFKRHIQGFDSFNQPITPAELQDADGNTMTAAEAKTFVATLP